MNILDHIKDVPLYQESLSKSLDFTTFPLLDKQSLVKNFPLNLLTPTLQKALDENRIEYNSTSGTTSDRLQIIRAKNWWDTEEERIAPYTRLWGQFLHDDAYSRAILTTPMCSNAVCYKENPSYEKRIIGKKLYLNTTASPDLWTAADVEKICFEIDRFKPMHVHADPIYLALFFQNLSLYNIKRPTWIPQFLTLSFEYAPRSCRKFIQSFWDIPTYTLYGLTELGYLFCECEHGVLHWCEPLNFLHFLPIDGKAHTYNLAVTSFKNEFMPLVKYVTNDLFYIPPAPNRCQCSHPSSVIVHSVVGRLKDLTRTDSNEYITVDDIDKALSCLKTPPLLYQLDHTIDGKIECFYLTSNGQSMNISSEMELCQTIQQLYGKNREVTVKHLSVIKPAPSGKFQLIKNG